MIPPTDASHPFPRLLTARYIVALSLIALLLLVGFWFLQTTLIREAADAQTINIAGRQRMLSQKISKAALLIEHASDASARSAALQELAPAATLWEESSNALQHGSPILGIPDDNSATVQSLFAEIEQPFGIMLKAAHCLVAVVNTTAGAECDLALSTHVNAILDNEAAFLTSMDAVVTQYTVESHNRIDTLRAGQLVLLVATLTSLLIEALFVFRPVVERLRHDLAELLHVQEALRESRQFAEHVTEYNPNIIYIYDIEEHRNVYSNREIASILGYTASEIQEMGEALVTHLMYPEDMRLAWLPYLERIKAAKDGETIDLEYRMLHKNGEWRWLYSRVTVFRRTSEGKVKQYLGNAQDVTERKRAEETLRLTQFSVERATDLILWIGKDGHFLDVNRSASKTLGYSRDELLSMNVQDVLPELPGGSWAAQWKTLRQTGALHSELQIALRDGTIIPGEVSVDFMTFGDKEYIVAFVRNIAERKQAEKALRKAKEDAEAANRAKSTFLANMSHELRTPLNAILGFAQLLRTDQALSHEQRGYLDTILRSGEHLLELINDVLEMSKIEAGRAVLHEQNFDLHRMLDSVAEMLYVRAQSKELVLLFDPASQLPQYVRGDERKLRQVLINLIGNAIKFTQEGGVNVRVDCKRLGTPNAADTSQGAAQLLFEIEDTGVGMEPHELDKLFGLFVQTQSGQSALEGTGLGLAISREFICLMGGDITVSSQRGSGTLVKFDVRVQLTEVADIQPVETERHVVGLEADQRTYRILVAEDKPENRLLLTRLMQSVGFDVREAVNGWEAVQVYNHWQPDLIWMDMRMPVMDGYEATERIRQHPQGKSVVIIALTASAFDHERTDILKIGCNDAVPKPFQASVLFEKLARHLNVRFRYDEQNAPASELTPWSAVPPNTLSMPDCTLSPETLTALKSAATELDTMMAQAVIDTLQEQNAALAATLSEMVRTFRFDKLLDVIQHIEEQTSS